MASAAADMARRHWRDDPQPTQDSLLRRAVTRAGGAISAYFLRGRHAFAVVFAYLQSAFALGRDHFHRVLRRLLLRRPSCPRRRAEATPPPPPPTQPKNMAAMYKDDPNRRRRHASPTPAPASPHPPPVIVDGEVVPDEEVTRYEEYCRASRMCSSNSKVCHLCFFEMERAKDCVVRTNEMIWHCSQLHGKGALMCGKVGCMIKVRSARDLKRHVHFCHTPTPTAD